VAGETVHLSNWPEADTALIDSTLETQMQLAQQATSMILALRKRANKKVRQPLQKAVIPVQDEVTKLNLLHVSDLIKAEVNVKELQIVTDDNAVQLVKKIRPNFKVLGKKVGAQMKAVAAEITQMTQEQIRQMESEGQYQLTTVNYQLIGEDVEILTEDMPGWLVANEGLLTIALDIEVSNELLEEGIARELINRIQNLRKSSGLEITDRIQVELQKDDNINQAVLHFSDYISSQVLAQSLCLVDKVEPATELDFEDFCLYINIKKA